jgi:hypothetical protein
VKISIPKAGNQCQIPAAAAVKVRARIANVNLAQPMYIAHLGITTMGLPLRLTPTPAGVLILVEDFENSDSERI